jgi:2,3-dimethylmalate lyase
MTSAHSQPSSPAALSFPALGSQINASTKRANLRRCLNDPTRLTAAPGVFDMVSARIASSFGFDCLYMTGFGSVASAYGLPDAGIASYTEMLAIVQRLCANSHLPIICDGDTGYGGPLNVHHAVRGYEAAGAAGIQLEDQEFPKKCGHTLGRRVIPLDDAVLKIRAAVAAKLDPNFLIVARTDARTTLGLDSALDRARAFSVAGADVLFVESPETEAEMRAIGALGRELGKPMLVNCVEGGRTPVLARAQLLELGYRLAIYPVTSLLTVVQAMHATYAAMLPGQDGVTLPLPHADFKDLTHLMGFESVYEFEQTLLK